MKYRFELNNVYVCVLPLSNGQWQYELWAKDPDEWDRKYIGSNEFQYKTPEDALKAGLEHREEWCKPQEEE